MQQHVWHGIITTDNITTYQKTIKPTPPGFFASLLLSLTTGLPWKVSVIFAVSHTHAPSFTYTVIRLIHCTCAERRKQLPFSLGCFRGKNIYNIKRKKIGTRQDMMGLLPKSQTNKNKIHKERHRMGNFNFVYDFR